MITQSELKRQLHYDPDTGVFIWAISNTPRIKVGVIAGSKNSIGYIQVGINGAVLSAHRLAWLYMTGEMPANDIDHINRIRDDNRFCNLREATRSENMRNTTKKTTNTSGFKGVTWYKPLNKWKAQFWDSGRNKHLGYFSTPELAYQAYYSFASSNVGDFYHA